MRRLAVFALIELVPYGREHTNPPVRAEPNWDSKRTRQLAVDACFACHSNQTLVLNFLECDRPQEAGEAAEAVRDGEMPPWQFKVLHPEARLSDTEKQDLIRGLEATLAR